MHTYAHTRICKYTYTHAHTVRNLINWIYRIYPNYQTYCNIWVEPFTNHTKRPVYMTCNYVCLYVSGMYACMPVCIACVHLENVPGHEKGGLYNFSFRYNIKRNTNIKLTRHPYFHQRQYNHMYVQTCQYLPISRYPTMT